MTDPLVAKNVALVESFLDALNHWDFDKLAAIVADDFVFRVPFKPAEFDGDVDGRDNWFTVVKNWSALVDGTENLHDIRVDAMANNPNEVITFYKSDMKMKSGGSYKNDYIGRFLIEDGLITRFDEHFDSVPFVFSLGGTITFPEAAH
jgi:ketosteroid isomerase-like protein